MMYLNGIVHVGDFAEVGHGDDLQHLFDFGTAFGGQQTIEPESPDEEFSKNLVRLLVSFAIHG